MSSTSGFGTFENALREWAADVQAYLARQPGGGMQACRRVEEWQLDNDGMYRRAIVEERAVGVAHIDALLRLGSYHGLEEAASASPQVSSHFDTLVGTQFSRSRVDLRSLALSVLPSDQMLLQPVTLLSVDARVKRLLRYLTQDGFDHIVYTPLRGVSIGERRLELEPGLAIERMSEQEVRIALNHNFIIPPLKRPSRSSAPGSCQK